MDADKLSKIRKKCDDAQGGYSGVREVDYARDVAALLKELDLVTAAGELLGAMQVETAKQLTHQTEVTDLWKRDCEAAQMRVRDLEQDVQKIMDVTKQPDQLYGRPIVYTEESPMFKPEDVAIQKPGGG